MKSEKQGHRASADEQTFASVIREVSTSVKDMVQSEVDLIKAEIIDSSRNLGKHAAEAAIFGALAGFSILPFLAFLVIGLGTVMEGNYWLSSLIVAVVCAIVGGVMTFRAYKKIKEQDLTFPATRQTLEQEKETITEKVEDVKDATKRRAA